MTVREAAEEWVRELDAIQQGMIEELMCVDPDDWSEVTVPAPGDTVYLYGLPLALENRYGKIQGYDNERERYAVRLTDGRLIFIGMDGFEVQRDEDPPMWGTMWSFRSVFDDLWLESDDGIWKMSECGFRIYKSEKFGFFFGIDGAGYDFYECHWLPLYKARGLRWHDMEIEK